MSKRIRWAAPFWFHDPGHRLAYRARMAVGDVSRGRFGWYGKAGRECSPPLRRRVDAKRWVECRLAQAEPMS